MVGRDCQYRIAKHGESSEVCRQIEALAEEAERISPIGRWHWNVGTGEVHWSHGTFGVFGYSPETDAPSYLLFITRAHQEDRRGLQRKIFAAVKDRTDFEHDYRIVLPDGPTKYLQLRGHFFPSHTDEPEFIGTVTDITEKRNTENELRSALRECQQAKAALEMAYAEIQTLKDRLSKEKTVPKQGIEQIWAAEQIVGISPAVGQVLADVEKVAPTNSSVLITGATGTGKELLARAIHNRSRRSGQAFIPVNCAAIPTSLIGSELFGHEKGSFTGAIQRHVGRFEMADGGTIFLDEVGELPQETQIALLRVLQDKEIDRVGGNGPVPVDVRVLAATNRDLSAAVASGSFRADLFYRLNVFPINIPSLCERREDIPLLAEYFVKRFAARAGKRVTNIDKATLELFQSYDWPGNVRELQNVVERAIILCEGETFSIDGTWIQPQIGHPGPLITTLAGREKALIEATLLETHGRVSGPHGAAAKLGIPRTTLESKIRRLAIEKYEFKRHVSPAAAV